MSAPSQDQAKPLLQQPEMGADSSRYAAPSVVEADRLNAITGTPKVTG